jgi:nucleoside-diphosphate-sugar epimerase
MVALIERRGELDAFATYHMAGHWDADGGGMARAVQRALVRHGASSPRILRFPWRLARLAALFDATMRELLEMRYLWEQPARMDNARLIALLGAEPHTPLDAAVEATLAGLGCLPRAAEGAAALTGAAAAPPTYGNPPGATTGSS